MKGSFYFISFFFFLQISPCVFCFLFMNTELVKTFSWKDLGQPLLAQFQNKKKERKKDSFWRRVWLIAVCHWRQWPLPGPLLSACRLLSAFFWSRSVGLLHLLSHAQQKRKCKMHLSFLDHLTSVVDVRQACVTVHTTLWQIFPLS